MMQAVVICHIITHKNKKPDYFEYYTVDEFQKLKELEKDFSRVELKQLRPPDFLSYYPYKVLDGEEIKEMYIDNEQQI